MIGKHRAGASDVCGQRRGEDERPDTGCDRVAPLGKDRIHRIVEGCQRFLLPRTAWVGRDAFDLDEEEAGGEAFHPVERHRRIGGRRKVRRDLLHDRRIAHVAQVDVELHQIAEAQALLSRKRPNRS